MEALWSADLARQECLMTARGRDQKVRCATLHEAARVVARWEAVAPCIPAIVATLNGMAKIQEAPSLALQKTPRKPVTSDEAETRPLAVRITAHLYERASYISRATGQPMRAFVESGLELALSDIEVRLGLDLSKAIEQLKQLDAKKDE